jgi:hypothetical protein
VALRGLLRHYELAHLLSNIEKLPLAHGTSRGSRHPGVRAWVRSDLFNRTSPADLHRLASPQSRDSRSVRLHVEWIARPLLARRAPERRAAALRGNKPSPCRCHVHACERCPHIGPCNLSMGAPRPKLGMASAAGLRHKRAVRTSVYSHPFSHIHRYRHSTGCCHARFSLPSAAARRA